MSSAVHDYVPQCVPLPRVSGRVWLTWGVIVVGACAFLGLIVGAPLARIEGHEGVAGLLYHAFGVVCHQMPARSFFLWGQPLAVCARCFGVYAGFIAGALGYPLVRSLARRDVPARRWLLLAALPTSVDFMLGVTGLWANTHTSRALTGALLGATVALYVIPGLLDLGRLVRQTPRGRQPILHISEGKAE